MSGLSRDWVASNVRAFLSRPWTHTPAAAATVQPTQSQCPGDKPVCYQAAEPSLRHIHTDTSPHFHLSSELFSISLPFPIVSTEAQATSVMNVFNNLFSISGREEGREPI